MNTAMTSSATDNAGKTTRARQNGQDNAGMTMPTIRRQAMTDLFDNPMGLDGFEFVEFAALERGVLEPVFEMMGFALVARHKTKDVDLWRQGDINFIANYEKHSPAWYYAEEHGPSACGMAFRVRDAAAAYALALDNGAQPIDIPCGPMELKLPAIRGIGGAILYLIDRYEDGSSIYDIDFIFEEGVERHPVGCGFRLIDHLTHNVYRGRMDYWAGYYERCSTSARSASSTSRASTRGSSRGP
jgi:4-hydroxyphenylpyruvate dioxygenase